MHAECNPCTQIFIIRPIIMDKYIFLTVDPVGIHFHKKGLFKLYLTLATICL